MSERLKMWKLRTKTENPRKSGPDKDKVIPTPYFEEYKTLLKSTTDYVNPISVSMVNAICKKEDIKAGRKNAIIKKLITDEYK